MRTPLVAGNWKMNKGTKEAVSLVRELTPLLQPIKGVEKVLCPPFTSIMPVYPLIKGTDIGLGAQNLHWEESGAFTGEVSPSMVAEFAAYVIVGHSERRTYFGETDETANKRMLAGLKRGLTVLFCVGETDAQYEAEETQQVLERQLTAGLAGIPEEDFGRLVIAYEPVWAIGTGKAATKEQADRVIGQFIRPVIKSMYGEQFTATRVLYGGSVNAKNAAEYFGLPEIDGALVGGASLKPAEFAGIVEAARVRIS